MLYYATLLIMLLAFAFVAAQATTACGHTVCQEPMSATGR